MERDVFANMDEKEIKELRRATPWLRPGYMDEKAMNELAGKISEKKGRAIQLSSYANNSDEMEIDSLAKTLNPILLYEEVKTRCLTSKASDKTHLIHQALQKSNTMDHTRLFEWHSFIETIQPFISSVEYHVKSKKKSVVTHHSTSLVLSNKDLRVVVQDKLIESHFDETLFTSPELVEAIERILEASLIKLVIFRDMAFYFFEWEDPMPFVFVIAFRIVLVDVKDQTLAQNTVVTLHRKDVMDFTDEEDERAREAELAKQKAKKEKRTKKNALITPNSKSLLKALIGGMKEDDEDDDDEEAGELTMDVEETIIASKIQHLNSMTLEKEYLLKSFINNVRGSNVSYRTIAYVKRY